MQFEKRLREGVRRGASLPIEVAKHGRGERFYLIRFNHAAPARRAR